MVKGSLVIQLHGDKGLQTIFDALKQNKTLKVLDVSDCDMHMTDTGVVSLADALHTNSTLETLNISSNHIIGEEGVASLADALHTIKINNTMEELFIDGNDPKTENGLTRGVRNDLILCTRFRNHLISGMDFQISGMTSYVS